MKLSPIFVALAVALASADARPQFRKSLGFGPALPHARFERGVATQAFHGDKQWRDVALEYLDTHHPTSSSKAWAIRDDSYTDARTGVTHAYVTQLINGIPVADGRINLNIHNGNVISFGDSFYTGTAPVDHELTASAVVHTHAGYCDQLDTAARDHSAAFRDQAQAQVPMTSDHDHGIHPALADVHQHNCDRRSLAQSLSGFAPSARDQQDPRAAALSFMLHATPSDSLASQIATDFSSLVNSIELTEVRGVAEHAPTILLANVPGTEKPVNARLAYVQTPSADGKSSELNLVWQLEVEMADNWYDAAVSAVDPSVVFSVADWVSDSPYYPQPEGPRMPSGTALPTARLGRPMPPASVHTDHDLSKGGPHTYNVFPWGVNDPTEGKRSVVKPQPDSLASPAGWHSIPAANDPSLSSSRAPVPSKPVWVNYTTTFGNNVFCQENWEGRSGWLDNYRPVSSSKWPELTFDYKYDPKKADDGLAEAQQWINNTITQLFYTSNMVHDFFYRYGFDEVSGNFQQYNFGKGGKENDAVITNAQDGSGYNNANFATPPDGSQGRCRMYLWNTASPYRDGDLEAGIVIHEFAHGLSTRLTGGPSDSSCLAFGEGGGMGEGWGDFLATMIRSTEKYSDYPMGSWAANMDKGIRNYPYSLNFTVNPSTYKFLDKPGYWGVHAIGEVWAEMLWTVAQKFIAKHGFSSSLFPPSPDSDNDFYRPRPMNSRGEPVGPLVPKHGNTLIVQLVIDGMKLQPCRPGFFEARNAIIQADEILTGGENLCEIWDGFAIRGLGPDADVIGKTPWGGGIRTDDFAVPAACRKAPEEPEELKSKWF
ncbi:Fungalysin metallopeptidase-domain-containing protein [Auriculariales sp. MPI-PUGE-AT-0066]|nr:Fungalysin metallopeptidase-domain-containing protein [Auriculariales sp. MPI-PUGE-AT-0066]